MLSYMTKMHVYLFDIFLRISQDDNVFDVPRKLML